MAIPKPGMPSGRTLALLATGVVLLALALGGFLRADRGVEISREEAIRIALDMDEIDFEPEKTEARVIRQGFRMSPIWAVVLTIPDPAGARDDFLRYAAVEINAGSGEILRLRLNDN